MRVRQWMSPYPVVAHHQATVGHARSLLARHGIEHLPVVKGGRVLGIVSHPDLVGAGTEDMLGTVATTTPVSISPESSIIDAAWELLSRHLGALPVVEHDELVGIVTRTDCLLALVASGGLMPVTDPPWSPPGSQTATRESRQPSPTGR